MIGPRRAAHTRVRPSLLPNERYPQHVPGSFYWGFLLWILILMSLVFCSEILRVNRSTVRRYVVIPTGECCTHSRVWVCLWSVGKGVCVCVGGGFKAFWGFLTDGGGAGASVQAWARGRVRGGLEWDANHTQLIWHAIRTSWQLSEGDAYWTEVSSSRRFEKQMKWVFLSTATIGTDAPMAAQTPTWLSLFPLLLTHPEKTEDEAHGRRKLWSCSTFTQISLSTVPLIQEQRHKVSSETLKINMADCNEAPGPPKDATGVLHTCRPEGPGLLGSSSEGLNSLSAPDLAF